MKNSFRANHRNQDIIIFFEFLLKEVVIVLIATLIIWKLKNWTFIRTLKHIYLNIGLAYISLLGRELFWAIDQNRWDVRKANNDVRVVLLISLIGINAVTCPFMLNSDKRFIVMIIPGFVWLFTIVESMVKRWWK